MEYRESREHTGTFRNKYIMRRQFIQALHLPFRFPVEDLSLPKDFVTKTDPNVTQSQLECYPNCNLLSQLWGHRQLVVFQQFHLLILLRLHPHLLEHLQLLE